MGIFADCVAGFRLSTPETNLQLTVPERHYPHGVLSIAIYFFNFLIVVFSTGEILFLGNRNRKE